MSIADRVTSFITGPNAGALAIVGKWGQGKTYFWRSVAEQWAPAAKATRKNYAYVSLFGLSSLADLRIELAQQIRPVEHMKAETFGALLLGPFLGERMRSAQWWARLWQKVAGTVKKGADVATTASVAVPHVGNLGPLYRGWAYSRVKNALICLDDLERRGSDLPLKDVLGLVSQLITERGCAVAVIFNEGTFSPEDQEVWKANREKVFLGEVLYSASPEACVGYVFKPEELLPLDKLARDAILDLGLTNVRIIERIKIACGQITAILPMDLLDETRERIARCLALYVYMVAGQGEGAPPIYEGMKSGLMRAVEQMNRGANAPAPDPQQKAWEDLLNRYGFHFHGELDESLVDAVKQGYPDAERVAAAAQAYDQSARHQVLDDEFSQAWRLFHDSYADNRDQVIERMSTSFFRLQASVSAANADSTIRLMRELGQVELARRMIAAWIGERTSIERWKELGKREVELFQPLEDQEFKTSIEEAHADWEKKTHPSFDELMVSLGRERFIQPDEEEQLAQADVETYVAYINAHPGPELNRAISTLLSLYEDPAFPSREIVRERLRAALRTVAEQNPTNRVRVAWKFPELPQADLRDG